MSGKLLASVEDAHGMACAVVGGRLDGFLRRGGIEGRDRVLLGLSQLDREVRRRWAGIVTERALVAPRGRRRSLRVEAEARREEAAEDLAREQVREGA